MGVQIALAPLFFNKTMKLNPEKQEIDSIARQILISARTSPKAGGRDDILTAIIEKQDIPEIIEEMRNIAKRGQRHSFFERDAKNLERSDGVLAIGVKGENMGLDCGACGMSCAEQAVAERKTQDYTGPNCIFKILDLGIAIGSAAKTAANLSIDTRIMFSIGLAVKRLRLMDADVVLALPLSISGKNPYFDR